MCVCESQSVRFFSRFLFLLYLFFSSCGKICVEGNIGCGKSCILNLFAQKCSDKLLAENRVRLVVNTEPVAKWKNVANENLLAKMYSDPVRWGFTFEHYSQLSRIKQMQDIKQSSENVVQILERSIYSNRHCFVENFYQRYQIVASATLQYFALFAVG